jgi:hypothetical protein
MRPVRSISVAAFLFTLLTPRTTAFAQTIVEDDDPYIWLEEVEGMGVHQQILPVPQRLARR